MKPEYCKERSKIIGKKNNIGLNEKIDLDPEEEGTIDNTKSGKLTNYC